MSINASPVQPRDPAFHALDPLGAERVHLTEGYWLDRITRNRAATLPHVLAWLHSEGTVANLSRLSADGQTPPRRGPRFTDSDLYKAMEGLAWAAGGHDQATRAQAAESLEQLAQVVASAQAADGYVNSWVQAGESSRYAELWDSHEIYCMGHLIQAGVAAHRTGASPTLFAVALAAADHLVHEFGANRRPDTDGHPVAEMALVELYRETGTRSYLDLAAQFVAARGHGAIARPDLGQADFGAEYYQDAVPMREQHEVVGHAVRALYLLAGAIDVAVESGDEQLLVACVAQWESMATAKTYVTGAYGSRFEGEAFGDPFELPPDVAYAETCASIAAMEVSWRLLLATGEGRYADTIEQIAYNTLSAAIAADGQAFFYVNPLQRRRGLPAAQPGTKVTRTDAPGTRPAWFECACCPSNLVRTIEQFPAMVATTNPSGVQIHQYVAGAVCAPDARLEIETSYPIGGQVTVRIAESGPTEWTLAVRIPHWAAGQVSVRVHTADGGQPQDLRNGNPYPGYLGVRRVWSAGDSLQIELPMDPRQLQAHPAVDAVRGQLALARGPVVYCAEGADNMLDFADLAIPADSHFSECWLEVCDTRTLALTTSAQTLAGDQIEADLLLIPYSMWANREPGPMRVWIPAAHHSLA